MASIIENEIEKRKVYQNKKKQKKKKNSTPKPYDAHKGKSMLVGKKLAEILGKD